MCAARSLPHVAVIGAGIGGLACALRLAGAGYRVTVLERARKPGGKMRTLPSVAGPVDAGPTVLTMRHVFDDLFKSVGARLDDHLRLRPLPILARHYWRDGTMLDLTHDPDQNATNIAQAFGADAARQFRAFADRARRLFDGFDAPMMQAAAPSQRALIAHTLRTPGLLGDMAPHRSLASLLAQSFDEPRLAQLFGRYATYVGGSPYRSPALLALIWQAEAAGVWRVEGGMHSLARAIEALAIAKGAVFRYGADVDRIEAGPPFTVIAGSTRVVADAVVFNGDPRALRTGAFGAPMRRAVRGSAVAPRSLSANVLAFAARATGPELAHHTVLFGDDPRSEFDALARGQVAEDSTLYICAQDRGGGGVRDGPERFELIQNAPPLRTPTDPTTGPEPCLTRITRRLAQFGLRFDPPPGPEALTRPQDFERLFPASLGALYGRSPAGLTAGLKRPTAQSRIPGLYLVGGGAHPGAGVPMATLSARHAAEAIGTDLPLT